MTNYFVTGATGFIGSRLVAQLLQRADCTTVYVLVRGSSLSKLDALSAQWPNSAKVVPVVGDLAVPRLGINDDDVTEIDHVVHLAANYDVTTSSEANDIANVTGTSNVLDFARTCGRPLFHHVSSIAVAGSHPGIFTEEDFEVGQPFPSAYHSTKFEAEALVRGQDAVPFKIYRPSVVVGDSRTGAMDKIDGPYYSLPLIARLASLPARLPLAGPNLGSINVVPVDYVVNSMCALMHDDKESGTVYHLSSPVAQPLSEIFNAFALAAGAPQLRLTFRRPAKTIVTKAPGKKTLWRKIIDGSTAELGMPVEALALSDVPVRFDNLRTREALRDLGLPDSPPPFDEYADVLFAYWAKHLDPDRARRVDPANPLLGRRVLVTGASSGVGRALSVAVAQRGAIVIMLARRGDELDAVREEIEAFGGQASCHPCDITDETAVAVVVKQILESHGAIDFLVNNAGRSIRRSMMASTERIHDFERTMSINYFAAVRLTLAFLPSMMARQSGHIVNITSQAVEGHAPRYAAYTSSKAALDQFSLVAGRDLLADGITFSNVRLPLVKTPMSAPSASVNRYLPMISAEHAAEWIIKRALIQRRETATSLSGRIVELSNIATPRLGRAASHLVAVQAMGETAPDGRALNKRHPAVSFSATAVRLVWRAMATKPIR